MQRNLFSKILAVGIVVLFLGVGIHPVFAIEDKTSAELLTKDDDIIKMPVSIHTSEGIQRHTLELTNQQVEELDKIFDKLKVDLWNSDSHYEVSEVYKEAIVSLSENGLLPDGLSVEEAQELVLKNTFNQRLGKLFSYLFNGLLPKTVKNFICIVAGKSTNTYIVGLPLFRIIIHGTRSYGMHEAVGWIHTTGLLLIQKLEGSFLGEIYYQGGVPPSIPVNYWGGIGFRGFVFNTTPISYIGRATWIWVEEI